MADYDANRARLEERLGALTRRAANIEADLRELPNADSQERVTESENDEVLERLDESALAEVESIRAALRRIAAGTYGTCSRCGGPIPPSRLDALPQASVCVACAA